MKHLRLIFVYGFLAILLLGFNSAFAKTEAGYVRLSDGVNRYVEWTPPQQGKPVIIFMNGLVYNINRWSPLTTDLKKQGYGVLNYYFRGQHLTLKKEVEEFKRPGFFQTGLTTEDLALEAKEILSLLKITEPVVVVGLSYGSSIAAEFARQFPESVRQLIQLAPIVRSLDKYDPTGAWFGWNLDQIRLWWGPVLGPAFYEMAYSALYHSYYNQRIVPDRVPEELKEIPEIYKESIFHLARAARNFDLRTYDHSEIQNKSVHYILAKEETEKIFHEQIQSFDHLAQNSKGVLIWLPSATHAVPDSKGALAAAYIDLLLKNDRRLTAGGKYKHTDDGLIEWKDAAKSGL